MDVLYRRTVASPMGPLELLATERGLCAISFGALPVSDRWRMRHFPDVEVVDGRTDALEAAEAWLVAYFAAEHPDPGTVPLDIRGTEFDRSVWEALLGIPEGRTDSYGALSQRMGLTNGARAVGTAAVRNPVAILVPCHRLLGASGKLTGYAGGLELKRWLLHHEGSLLLA